MLISIKAIIPALARKSESFWNIRAIFHNGGVFKGRRKGKKRKGSISIRELNLAQEVGILIVMTCVGRYTILNEMWKSNSIPTVAFSS